MEHVILGLLILKSMTLYELNRAFRQGISMFYSASYGSLQSAVKGLLRKGMIACTEKVERGRNKKVYSITANGQEAFYDWMLGETPLGKLEVTALAKVYFLGLVKSRRQRTQIVQEIVQKIAQAQGQLDSLNAALTRISVPYAHQDVFRFQMKTLDYGRQAHAFSQSWFLSLLQELETDPEPAAQD